MSPRSEGVQYANREERKAIMNSSRKNKVVRQKRKWWSVVYVSGGESKVWCYKEQYCLGTWKVMSMNQGKLNMVKQKKAGANIDILGISELKCTGMGKFISYDHYICYCGQESCRRNGVALKVNKRVWNAVWMQPKKPQNDLCSFPKQMIQLISNPSLHCIHWCWRSWI